MAFHSTQGTANNSAHLWSTIHTWLTGTVGWTLHDDRSAQASPTYIYHSDGESGEEDIYFAWQDQSGQTDKLFTIAYRYWDATGHTGYEPNPAAGGQSVWTDDDTPFLYWAMADLDTFIVITKQGSNYQGMYVGLIDSLYATDYAVTVNSESAGSNVVIEVDDASIFTVGKNYTIVNKNATTGTCEKVNVTARDLGNNTITVATLANAHPAGAVIAEDAQRCVTIPWYTNGPGWSTPSAWAQNGVLTNGLGAISLAPVQNADPDGRNAIYWLSPILVYHTGASQELRGYMRLTYYAGDGHAAEDTFTVGSEVYKGFVTASAGRCAFRVT